MLSTKRTLLREHVCERVCVCVCVCMTDKLKKECSDVLDNSDGRQVLITDSVDGRHERKLLAKTLLGQDAVHILGGRGAL